MVNVVRAAYLFETAYPISYLSPPGHFVRIQTMLRALGKPVKRCWERKTPLPIKSANCLARLFIKRARRCTAEPAGLHVCIQTVSLRRVLIHAFAPPTHPPADSTHTPT